MRDLSKYPHLKSYVDSYLKGDCEYGYIPDLIYFFKKNCIDHELDEQSLFDWDTDMAEDFYSWGHNSRWANTFWCFLDDEFDHCIDVAVWLVETYGDNDIYEEKNDG